MNRISSKSNDKIQHLKKLLTVKSYRYETKEFAVEGIRALDDIKGVKDIFVREDVTPPEISCENIYSVDKEVFKHVSSTENSQGVVATTSMNLVAPAMLMKNFRYVLLDRLQDPGNMGTIIRTVCALGLHGVIIMPGCVDPFSPKAVRAAASGIWKLDITKIESVSILKNYNLIAADIKGQNLEKMKWSKGFILCIGNEGNGLSEEIKCAATTSVAIPLVNSMESLNAAVSCGILLYSASKDLGL